MLAVPTCVGLTTLPHAAHAQAAGSILVFLTSIGSEDVSTLGEVSVGLEACESDAEIKFELDQVPAAKSQIDVYRGSDCTKTDRDDPDVGTCKFITSAPIEDKTLDLQVPIRASDLASAVGLEGCKGGTSTPTLWFLAVNDSQSNEEVGTDYGSFPSGSVTEFEIDADPPAPPGNVTGGSGENQIPVEWDSDETDLEEFIVFVDSNPGPAGATGADGGTSDGDCSSSVLSPGAAASGVPASVHRRTLTERSATGIDLSADDIDGDAAAVAVVAVDNAGNESKLSELACVEVVPTVGFWDRYQEQGGDADTGCRASGAARRTPLSALMFALTLVALAWRTRRRS